MPSTAPASPPIATASQLPHFTIDDVQAMRRLGAGPMPRRWLVGWLGLGHALRYLESAGMVRIAFDWERGRPVAELTHGAALWLAEHATQAAARHVR